MTDRTDTGEAPDGKGARKFAWTFRRVNDFIAACSDHEMPDGDLLAFYIRKSDMRVVPARIEWDAFDCEFEAPPLFRDTEDGYVSKWMDWPDLILALDDHANQIIASATQEAHTAPSPTDIGDEP